MRRVCSAVGNRVTTSGNMRRVCSAVGNRAHNVLLSGGIFHNFADTSASLAASFRSLSIDTEIHTDVEAGLERLTELEGDNPSLLTINMLRWQMEGEKYDTHREEWAFELSAEGQQAICSHVQRGGGLLVLHTGAICFDTWGGWQDVLGGAWKWGDSYHPPLGRVEVRPTGLEHPINQGMADQGFVVNDEVYTRLALCPDVEPILAAVPEDGVVPQPIMWARSFGEGRVVYDALGHDVASMEQVTHAKLLRRAALWALGRDDEIKDH